MTKRRRKVQQGDCWHTACVYAMEHPGAVYVEGWAVLYGGMIVEHGWCEVEGRTTWKRRGVATRKHAVRAAPQQRAMRR